MPERDLQRYPNLRTAYIRGWEKCMAGIPTPPPAIFQPTVRPSFVPPQRQPQPYNHPKPTTSTKVMPSTSTATASVKSGPGSTTSSTQSYVGMTYKEKKRQRTVDYRRQKKQELQRLTREIKLQSSYGSQQHRLAKTTEIQVATPPTPMPRTVPPIEVATEITEEAPMDIEVSAGELMQSPDCFNEDIETFLNQPLPSAP
ncbi:uncharacterized protein LOC126896055 [Daktulosphaira vitifoliae]|uniref:uncharacterized protein LOC126896055 n=1 Tax=Daktulosphaira vitifoliae TaxID=58002 RepID=UPI0021A9C390|nr:uncharacterized protein LOC126896055 [Daktulosphaira vitifoliae]